MSVVAEGGGGEHRLRRVWEAVSKSPDKDVMFEGKMEWYLATEVRTAVECVMEDLRRMVEPVSREELESGVGEGQQIRSRIESF